MGEARANRHTIMLDVDGVLICGRPQDGAPLFTDLEADLGLSLAELQRAFFVPRWADIVTGRKPLLPELSAALAEIAPTLKPETLIDYWFRNDSRINEDVLKDVDDLKARGHRVYLATNQEHLRAAYLMKELGLAGRVDGICYSAAIGYRKPATEFFDLATRQAWETPQNIVFLDDSRDNVTAARAYGWHAVHWQDGMSLSEQMDAFR